MGVIQNHLLKAKVAHNRLHPKPNGFVYNQHYVYIDNPETITTSNSLFSYNRWNLLSVRFRKYGDMTGDNPWHYVHKLLYHHNCPETIITDIKLLTQPALLGWSFNPVSFWFCFDKDGQLRAVLNEVNNTFGEHQKYIAYHDDFRPISDAETLKAKKVFYVSPFFTVEGYYTFRYKVTDKNVAAWIHYYRNDKLAFTSSLIGKRYTLSTINILQSVILNPIANLKTVGLIHWQAIILWFKKINYIPRKTHKKKEAERCR